MQASRKPCTDFGGLQVLDPGMLMPNPYNVKVNADGLGDELVGGQRYSGRRVTLSEPDSTENLNARFRGNILEVLRH
jgi:hypothetical protein